MKSFIALLVLTGLTATLSPAMAESRLAPVYEVPKVEFKEKAQWHAIKKQKRIHRIKTKEEFEKLGGKKTHVDFATRDLVIVTGIFGCDKGEVQAYERKKAIVFMVKITARCAHQSEKLHPYSYVACFAVNKNAVIVDKTDVIQPLSPLSTLQEK